MVSEQGGIHINCERMKNIVIEQTYLEDKKVQTALVEGGVTYSELIDKVDKAGLALDNLASLPHINVIGSILTGTHGSGRHKHILASSVVAIEFV